MDAVKRKWTICNHRKWKFSRKYFDGCVDGEMKPHCHRGYNTQLRCIHSRTTKSSFDVKLQHVTLINSAHPHYKRTAVAHDGTWVKIWAIKQSCNRRSEEEQQLYQRLNASAQLLRGERLKTGWTFLKALLKKCQQWPLRTPPLYFINLYFMLNAA